MALLVGLGLWETSVVLIVYLSSGSQMLGCGRLACQVFWSDQLLGRPRYQTMRIGSLVIR